MADIKPNPSGVDYKQFTREEFVELIMSNANKPSEIGRATSFIEKAFQLQNSSSRPSYIIEVNESVDAEHIEYLQNCLTAIGVLAFLVPMDTIKVIGEIRPEDFLK